MTPKQYNEIIREYFDISDTNTRRYIISLEDVGQDQLLTSLSSALYDKVVQKVDKIDFGTIPRSKGDITRVEGYENTMECLDIIRKLVVEYRENPGIVDTVLKAVDNIKQRKSLFMKAFSMDVELPILLYNLIVLSIEQSVSFLITVCIQYIKDPNSSDIQTALDTVSYTNTKENMIYQQLLLFNKSCENRDLDRTLETVIKNNGKIKESRSLIEFEEEGECDYSAPVDSPFKKFDDCPNDEIPCGLPNQRIQQRQGEYSKFVGLPPEYSRVAINGDRKVSGGQRSVEEFGIGAVAGILVGGAAALSFGLSGLRYLIKVIIPCIRNITYFFINSRVKLADSLELQAQFIEMNAYRLKYASDNKFTDKERERIVSKQLKWAERLKTWSNKIAIDNKKAEKDATELQKEEDKKMTIDDLSDYVPQDDGSLF